jgi:transglutaminase-like putative cysteine protease/tetratricopeptide (TPR) repeat protein
MAFFLRRDRVPPGALAVLITVAVSPAAAAPPAAGAAAIARAEDRFADGDAFAASAAYREALQALGGTPAGERDAVLGEVKLAILRLTGLAEETGEFAELEGTLAPWTEPLPERPAWNDVAALARFHRGLDLLERGGPRAEADAVWKPLGILERWRIIGPFDNERGGSFLTVLEPEKELRLDAAYDGKKRPVRWRELPARPIAGAVDLAALLVPNEQALAYALTFVRCEREEEATLRLASDEGFRVFWNGSLAASADIKRRMGFDASVVRVRLRPGWNSLLLKLAQSKGSWEFSARLSRPDGSPLVGWEEGTPDAAALSALAPAPPAGGGAGEKAGAAEEADLAAHGGPEDLLRETIAREPANHRAHYVLGAILLATKTHDENQHPDSELLERAIQIDAGPAVYHLALAESRERETTIAAEREENSWRQAMEKAAARGSASANLELASYYLHNFKNVEKSRRFALQALGDNPGLDAAHLLLGEIEAEMDFPRPRARALERTRALPARTTAAIVEDAQARAAEGRRAEAERTVAALLARNAWNGSARELRARLLAAGGDLDAAREGLLAGLALNPTDTSWLERLQKLEEGRNRPEEALAFADQALAIRPEDHDLHARRGELLILLGRKDDALLAFEKALELQPNFPDAREHAEFLRAAGSSFEDEFRRDAGPLATAAWERKDPNPKGDPVRYLLQLTAVKVNLDGTTKEYIQEVIQILNELGMRQYEGYRTYYADGEQMIEFKKAKVLHPDGSTAEAKLSRHGGQKSAQEEVTYRGAYVDLPPVSPGDVVVVEYVREDIVQSFFGDYFGRREVFQSPVPVDEKTFILRVPAGRKFYFHERHLEVKPSEARDEKDGTVTYSWTRKDIPRLDPEPGMPPAPEVSPTLEVSTFENWEAFGRWYWNLIKKQLEVSPEITKKVLELTSGADTELAKIRAIYNFVVTDIRYNAWEFGVHGFKPYNAATIFANRFGDCKDKATLLSVMLKEAGITSHPVLIYADNTRGKEDLKLPMVEHFNHCIAFVPPAGGRAELYLDGTAQFHNFEEVPSMDRGAEVLVIREEKGELRQVPWNEPATLAITVEATAALQADLAAELKVRAEARGDYAVDTRRGFEIAEKRKAELERIYGGHYAGSKVKEESFSNLLNLDEPVTFSVVVAVPRFAVEAREGLAVRTPEDIWGMTQGLVQLGSLETGKRTQDVLLGAPRRETMRMVIHLPAELKVKSLPATADVASRFGRFKAEFREEGPAKVVFERLVEITSPRVPLADYAEFREFTASIHRLEAEQMLLERS